MNAVIPIRTTATTNPPFTTPNKAPRKRSKPLNPTAFISLRAILPAMLNRIKIAKKMMRKPKISASHSFLKNDINHSARR